MSDSGYQAGFTVTLIARYSAFALTFLFAAQPVLAAPPQGFGDMPAPSVIVASVARSDIQDTIEAVGALKARESVDITATVTENISAIHFEDGQRVEAGDPLVEMTSKEEHAQIDELRVQLLEARKQYTRARNLIKDQTVSAAILDERRRDYEGTRARLAAMQSRLKDRLIVAPFSGVLGLRQVSVGTLVQPGTVIATLDDDTQMKLDFHIPSSALPSITTGLVVQAFNDAYPEQPFSGKIVSVGSRVDENTRTVAVRAVLDNPNHVLKTGMMMSVRLLGKTRSSLTIPEGAIVPLGSEHYVFMLPKDADLKAQPAAVRRKIVMGTRLHGTVEILKGLDEADRVITHGTMMTQDGKPVRVLGEETASRSARDILKSVQEQPSTPPAEAP